jgi:hypothetical protein
VSMLLTLCGDAGATDVLLLRAPSVSRVSLAGTGEIVCALSPLKGCPGLRAVVLFVSAIEMYPGFWSASNLLGSHPSLPQTRSEAVREIPDPPPGEASDGGSR